MNSSNDWQSILAGLAADMGPVDDETSHDESTAPDVQSAPIHISLERKGRAGKTATIIFGFTISDDSLRTLATELKTALGCGGSARGGEILLQGDRTQSVRPLLTSRGFKIK